MNDTRRRPGQIFDERQAKARAEAEAARQRKFAAEDLAEQKTRETSSWAQDDWEVCGEYGHCEMWQARAKFERQRRFDLEQHLYAIAALARDVVKANAMENAEWFARWNQQPPSSPFTDALTALEQNLRERHELLLEIGTRPAPAVTS